MRTRVCPGPPALVLSPMLALMAASRRAWAGPRSWTRPSTRSTGCCTGGRRVLTTMVKAFDAQLSKGDHPGAWTCVIVDDVPQLFGTRGLVKIRGSIDGQPFDGALM